MVLSVIVLLNIELVAQLFASKIVDRRPTPNVVDNITDWKQLIFLYNLWSVASLEDSSKRQKVGSVVMLTLIRPVSITNITAFFIVHGKQRKLRHDALANEIPQTFRSKTLHHRNVSCKENHVDQCARNNNLL